MTVHQINVMLSSSQKTIRKVTSKDLKVGLICADRDGNRVRIDRVNHESETVAYHFLNDELRVQEGVREVPIDEFVAECWYVA
jgi:predicted methyltransferase MtxX (methanogen marker protein 4)